MDLYTCDNCSTTFSKDEDYCPNCGIPANNITQEDLFICPICNAKNKLGETKCSYCCSIFQ